MESSRRMIKDIPTLPKHNIKEALGDGNISNESISKKLKTLNSGKSPGRDRVHAKVLKKIGRSPSTPLYLIFKTSIDTAIWREANVTAIFKNKENSWQAGNYRPVSLTSVVCKVMELFVRDIAWCIIWNKTTCLVINNTALYQGDP